MKQFAMLLALIACNFVLGITIDGRLDDAEWTSAKEYTGFKTLAAAKEKSLSAQTSFKIISEADRIYIGIKCDEPLMPQLQQKPYATGGIWESDAVEIFLAPSGNANEFYQFLLCFGGKTETNYWAEAGKIRPAPYMPEWHHAIYAGKDFWSAEVELPISAFYMTRQQLWSQEWALNICRNRNPVNEHSSWRQLTARYFEPQNFGKIGGFPRRNAEDDVYVPTAKAEINAVKNGLYSGKLSLNVNLSTAGEYIFAKEHFKLQSGTNSITVPFTFEKEGKNIIPIELLRVKDNKRFRCWYPVNIKYEPIKIILESPQYRNNFYPGQDHSHITGKIQCSIASSVTLSLKGPGITPQKITLNKGQEHFSFKTADFQFGTATITASTKGTTTQLKVRNLPPTNTKMAWVEDGNLVVMNPGEKKGKAILPRNISAIYYSGGEAFRKRFDADKNLHVLDTPSSEPTIEPARLVKNIEQEYGIYDVKPPQELFDKIDEIIEKNKNKNFSNYYICDEPECRNISPLFQKYVYDYVAEKDPYHVIMMATRACDKYIDCADWFQTHPYIDPMEENGRHFYGRDFNTLGSYLDEISCSGRQDKVIGFIPSIFSYKFNNTLSQYPTFEEIVCHTWAAMCHGGKSLWPYAYMDMGDRPALYEGTRYIFSTFEALQDFMLFAKRNVLLRTDLCEVVHYKLPNEQMFVAVNFTAEKQKIDLTEGTASYLEFRGNRTFNKISFTLKPHEVIVGTTAKRDAGLPTYNEVLATVNRLEAERLASPSLLFGKEKQIVVTASKRVKFPYKLFDGVRDVLAHSDAWGNCRFVELSFSNFTPRFSKVGIYGKNIGDTIVKIRKGGKWITLTPSNSTAKEFSLVYEYAQPYTTVKLRLEFPQNCNELYEVELIAPEGENKAKNEDIQQSAHLATPEKLDAVWSLDATNTEYQKDYSSKKWYGKETRIIPAEEGGFKMYGSAIHFITLKPKHWLQMKLVQAKRLPNANYFNWGMYIFKGPGRIAGNIGRFETGLYTINLPEVTKEESLGASFYNYGLELHFKYIALVKEPENYICAEIEENRETITPGTAMTVTLKLKEPCEEVTCKIMRELGQGPDAFPINGSDAIELKPVNGDFSHWQAKMIIQKYPKGVKETGKRSVMLKAIILGGKIDTPIYTSVPAAFKDM